MIEVKLYLYNAAEVALFAEFSNEVQVQRELAAKRFAREHLDVATVDNAEVVKQAPIDNAPVVEPAPEKPKRTRKPRSKPAVEETKPAPAPLVNQAGEPIGPEDECCGPSPYGPVPAEPPAAPAAVPTMEELSKAVTALYAAKGLPYVRSLLGQFGADRVSTLAEEKRAAFLAEVMKAIPDA